MTENATNYKKSKHIDLCHHFIQNAILKNLVKVDYLNTEEMPVDILTKGLSSERHYITSTRKFWKYEISYFCVV